MSEENNRGAQGGLEGGQLGFLTREELAEVLKVSVRTVDRMLADGEITSFRVRTTLVRFYLPDVVRQLVATALTRKNGRKAALPGNPKSEIRNPREIESPKSEAAYPRRAE